MRSPLRLEGKTLTRPRDFFIWKKPEGSTRRKPITQKTKCLCRYHLLPGPAAPTAQPLAQEKPKGGSLLNPAIPPPEAGIGQPALPTLYYAGSHTNLHPSPG